MIIWNSYWNCLCYCCWQLYVYFFITFFCLIALFYSLYILSFRSFFYFSLIYNHCCVSASHQYQINIPRMIYSIVSISWFSFLIILLCIGCYLFICVFIANNDVIYIYIYQLVKLLGFLIQWNPTFNVSLYEIMYYLYIDMVWMILERWIFLTIVLAHLFIHYF